VDLVMMASYSIKDFVFSSGERYCVLIDDETRIPDYYTTLYITTQGRNASDAVATMRTKLAAIKVLMVFCCEHDVDLEYRFLRKKYLTTNEVQALADFCTRFLNANRRDRATPRVVPFKRGIQKVEQTVQSATTYVRLSYIASFLQWLATTLVADAPQEPISRMLEAISGRKPPIKARNQERVKGFGVQTRAMLEEIINPASPANPFHDKGVRARNELMILMLKHLGVRGGELLNIRIREDIDFQTNTLVVARRADQRDDPRTNQPLVKTVDRRVALSDVLVESVQNYIVNHRKKVPNAGKCHYLFVVHKEGPTQGQPLSKSGYRKVFSELRQASPELANLHGHGLRHDWNEIASEFWDAMPIPPSEKEQEQMRSYLMGWKEGSGTAKKYNERFIRRKARETQLEMQKGMIRRVPKGVKSGQN
jgi:integrase